MSRRARLTRAGVPLHIVQRGNNRNSCFLAERDYRYYLSELGELAGRFECSVHAYVLMTNHVHLLLTPDSKTGASLLMKHLGQRYVQYVNRSYERTGTLWDGRFKSSLVQRQNYFFRCHRYIELNPVRAGMVSHPGDYPWSSYRCNADGNPSALLTAHDLYKALGDNPAERGEAYRQLFSSELRKEELEEIRSATDGGFALGDQTFKDALCGLLGRRVQRVRQRLRERSNKRA